MYIIREYGNSLKLIYKKMPGVSSVSFGLWFDTGSRNEDVSINGISHFLEHLVFKGSKKYSGYKIKESIEGLGGSLNAFTSEENTCYYAKFLGKHLRRVSGILSDMTCNPLLKSEDIEKERTVIIEEIKMYKDLPQFQVQEIFDALLWPRHPLGRNIAGSIESVSGISSKSISEYHNLWYAPANMVISCAGNLDEKVLEDFVANAFSKKRPGRKGAIVAFKSVSEGPKIKILQKDIEQTHIALGFPGLNRSHKDRFVLGVLNVILGGNMSSRLFNEVREKKGMAYEIASHIKKLKDTGVFFVHAGVDNRNMVEAARLVFTEFLKLKKKKVSSGELKRAKDFLLAQTEMALDDSLDHMLWMGGSLINTGFIYTKEEVRKKINRISSADIKNLAHEIIDWQGLRFAAVGPQKSGLEDDIRALIAKFS